MARRQKISQMTPKGANLQATDLLEISELSGTGYITKSITGQEIIDAASGGSQDLQQVTDIGATTTNSITITSGVNEATTVSGIDIKTENTLADTYATLIDTGVLALKSGAEESSLQNTAVTNPGVILEFPDKASGSYTIATTADLTSGTVTSVDLTMPSAFTVTGNPITTAGTLAVAGAGVATQYIRGDGQLANFPTTTGGGASVSYYLNGSVSQGTFGGVAMKEINKTPVIGAGTDFTINANGYIQSFITDANDPNQLEIPAGNWNFETYFSASSSGGTPSFYVELYKWDGATLTLIASNSTNPEGITGGTAIDLYLTAVAVPQTTLALTDRLAVRIYVTHSGRTITLHTEDNHLSQIITTFSTGLTALNGLTAQVQNLAVGTSGTDFAISSVTSTHTFNLPTASATNRGALSSADWSTFDGKQANLVSGTNIKTINSNSLLGSGNLSIGLTYFTEAQNTTAPNATVPVDSLTAVSAATNADFAIIPKGNGAIIADIPDGLVAGGNKRGTGAVDLQMSRLVNTEVASGSNSVVSGGYRNTASNTDSSVGGGIQNTASGTQSRVGGGNQNTASSDYSTVGGGTSNTASASRTTVAGGSSCTATAYSATTTGGFGNTSTNNYASNLGGQGNTASGQYATVIGGATNSASGSYALAGGVNSIANANFSQALGYGGNVNSIIGRNAYGKLHTAVGDAQTSTFIFAQRTTNATITTFTIDGAGAATNNQLILNNNSSYRFKGTIIAKQTATTNVAAWDIDGLLVRGANAASTTLIVSNVTLVSNLALFGTPILTADTTNGGLKIQITGLLATNIQWVANIQTTEVIY